MAVQAAEVAKLDRVADARLERLVYAVHQIRRQDQDALVVFQLAKEYFETLSANLFLCFGSMDLTRNPGILRHPLKRPLFQHDFRFVDQEDCFPVLCV